MKFVFLLYVSRSGSTLLSRHLGDHLTATVALPENRLVEVLVAEGDRRLRSLAPEQLLSLLQLDPQLPNLALGRDELVELAQSCAGRGAREILEQIARQQARRAGMSAVEACIYKHGTNLHIAQSILALIPDARFIHVYRDGRAAASSALMARHPYYPGETLGRGDIVHIARRWGDYMLEVERLSRSRPGALVEVRYESFCEDPQAVVRELAEFLQMGFTESDPDAHRAVVGDREKQLHPLAEGAIEPARARAWESELDRRDALVFEKIAGEVLRRRGYDLRYLPHATALELFAAQARSYLRRPFHEAGFLLRRLPSFLANPSKALNKIRQRKLRRQRR